jgi:hypothetical protein
LDDGGGGSRGRCQDKDITDPLAFSTSPELLNASEWILTADLKVIA